MPRHRTSWLVRMRGTEALVQIRHLFCFELLSLPRLIQTAVRHGAKVVN